MQVVAGVHESPNPVGRTVSPMLQVIVQSPFVGRSEFLHPSFVEKHSTAGVDLQRGREP